MPSEATPGQGATTPPSEIPPSSANVIAAAGPGTTPDFERLYNGLRGTLKANQAMHQTREGEYQQQIANLQQRVTDIEKVNTSITEENTVLAAQVGQLDELKAQAGQLPIVQAREEKLKTIMRYPTLMAATKVVVTKNEAGEDVETRENPYFTLAMTSTLQGPEFDTMLRELSQVVPTQEQETPAAPSVAPLAGSTPAPAPQAPEDTLADLRRQRNEAREAQDFVKVSTLQDAIMDQLAQQQ